MVTISKSAKGFIVYDDGESKYIGEYPTIEIAREAKNQYMDSGTILKEETESKDGFVIQFSFISGYEMRNGRPTSPIEAIEFESNDLLGTHSKEGDDVMLFGSREKATAFMDSQRYDSNYKSKWKRLLSFHVIAKNNDPNELLPAWLRAMD